MSTYAIGDIQGCYSELQDLLEKINFDPGNDRLWFTGDLVNRGPQSLQTLRFVRALGENAVTTLGNHDLHLLAVAFEVVKARADDTLTDILKAPDWPELCEWVRHLPLLHRDESSGFSLVHAGLAPDWDSTRAAELARAAEQALQADNHRDFFAHMYGDIPDHWSDDLSGHERLRVIINAFTRLRYCDATGRFALKEKGPPGSQAASFQPWFTLPGRKSASEKIIFGHWSTLHLGNIKNFNAYNVYPLDTGCLWGGALTALRLEDEKYFSVPSRQRRNNTLS